MELLKNRSDFETWKEENIFSGDEAENPTEYPCFVRTIVKSWIAEEEKSVYLYQNDFVEMLSQIESVLSD